MLQTVPKLQTNNFFKKFKTHLREEMLHSDWLCVVLRH